MKLYIIVANKNLFIMELFAFFFQRCFAANSFLRL